MVLLSFSMKRWLGRGACTIESWPFDGDHSGQDATTLHAWIACRDCPPRSLDILLESNLFQGLSQPEPSYCELSLDTAYSKEVTIHFLRMTVVRSRCRPGPSNAAIAKYLVPTRGELNKTMSYFSKTDKSLREGTFHDHGHPLQTSENPLVPSTEWRCKMDPNAILYHEINPWFQY